jgi:hypothetical protein
MRRTTRTRMTPATRTTPPTRMTTPTTRTTIPPRRRQRTQERLRKRRHRQTSHAKRLAKHQRCDARVKWGRFRSQAKYRGIEVALTQEQYTAIVCGPCLYILSRLSLHQASGRGPHQQRRRLHPQQHRPVLHDVQLHGG